jgi:hypothetical protein
VILFKFAGKNLLFAGDAQAGNWEYWLYRPDTPTSNPTKAGELLARSREILKTINFYKVGHHGSTNATPIPVVDAFGPDHSPADSVAMCSTQVGTHGNAENDSEVPRDPLMEALAQEFTLIRSDSLRIETSDGFVEPAAGVAPADLSKLQTGTIRKDKLYIEYSF